MPASQSGDEFDTIPDDFAGIDWNTIPELQGTVTAVSPAHPEPQPEDEDEDKFDDLPDPFAGIDWNTVAGLDDGHTATPRPSNSACQPPNGEIEGVAPPAQPASTHSSSHYEFDEVDGTLLEEVDAIEVSASRSPVATPAPARADAPCATYIPANVPPVRHPLTPSNLAATTSTTHTSSVGSEALLSPSTPRMSPSNKRALDSEIPTTPRKRTRRIDSSPVDVSPRKKGKKGKDKEDVDPFAHSRQVLAEFEDELSCAICCDLLAAAHIANPCGHTICGECGFDWISRNKRAPTCAICRTKLIRAAPLIPNIAMDNTIAKHVGALAASGCVDWQPTGAKHKEWAQRREKWKQDVARRAQEPREPVPPRPPVRASVSFTQEMVDLMEYLDALDGDYEDSGDEEGDDEY